MQVFVMDKRRAEESGASEPVNRIKKDLLQEIQAIQPADRVVVIGCCTEPFNCTKKDSESLLAAFDKHFYIPLPDYGTRQACTACFALLQPMLQMARFPKSTDPALNACHGKRGDDIHYWIYF